MPIIETMVDEISQFLKISREETYRRIEEEIFNPGINVAKAWKQANPSTEEEALNFYRTTDAYLFDLYVEHQKIYRKKLLEKVMERLKYHNVKSVLDYGGGAGFDAVAMRDIGIDVIYFELRSLTSEFAKWRFEKSRHADIKIESDENALKNYSFDAILCLEVLEHTPQPMEVIELFSRLLKNERIILLSEAFGLVGDEYPSHLKANQRYAGRIFSMMEKYGLICTYQYSDSKPLEFKKIKKGLLFIVLSLQRSCSNFSLLIRKVITRLGRIF